MVAALDPGAVEAFPAEVIASMDTRWWYSKGGSPPASPACPRLAPRRRFTRTAGVVSAVGQFFKRAVKRSGSYVCQCAGSQSLVVP
jgi:hypothetical protein